MKRSRKIAVGIAASLTLGLATAVYADQGGTGAGAHGKGGMQHGMQGATGHGAEGHGAQMQARMAQMHAQMQTRGQEHGATGPRHQGPRTGAASGPETQAQTPSTTEHVH
jgi:hypothetical protein